MQLGMKRLVASGATLAAVLMMATPAHAGMLGVSDGKPVAGQRIVVNGDGCKGDVKVTVKAFGQEFIGRSGPGGGFSIAIDVPDGLPEGADRNISAKCFVRRGVTRFFRRTITIVVEVNGPNNVSPGQLVTYRGGGCAPGSNVIAKFNGNRIDTSDAGGQGNYIARFRIPAGANPGSEGRIVITCDQTYPPGSTHVDRIVVDIV